MKPLLIGALLFAACGADERLVHIDWTTTTMPFHASGMAQAYIPNEGLVIFGGMGFPWEERSALVKFGPLGTVETIDTDFDRAYTKGFALNDSLYVISGRKGMEAQSSFLKVNLNGMVNTLPTPRIPRLSFSLNTLPNGDVLIGGGYNGPLDTATDSLELYQPLFNRWIELETKMPEGPTTHADGFTYKGEPYIYGGFYPANDGTRDYHRGIYKLDGQAWIRIAELPIGLSGMASIVWNNHVLIMGGSYAYPTVPETYEYSNLIFDLNMHTNEITQLDIVMPQAANDIQISLNEDLIYIVGGEALLPATSNKLNVIQIGALSYDLP